MNTLTAENFRLLDTLKPWDVTPKITNEDLLTLTPVVGNNTTLVAFLRSKKATEENLKKIILIEFVVRLTRRAYVVERCLGKLHTLQRVRAETILNKAYYARKGRRT